MEISPKLDDNKDGTKLEKRKEKKQPLKANQRWKNKA